VRVNIFIVVTTLILVLLAFIPALQALGLDLRIHGRKLPLPPEAAGFSALTPNPMKAWLALGLSVLSLIVSLFAAYHFFHPRIIEKAVDHFIQAPVKPASSPHSLTSTGLLTIAGQKILIDGLQHSGLEKTDNIWFSVVSAQDANELDRANQLKEVFSRAALGERSVTTHGQVWFGTAFHGTVIRVRVQVQDHDKMNADIQKAIAVRDAFRAVMPVQIDVMPDSAKVGTFQIIVGQT
jgi:hypothetical protein